MSSQIHVQRARALIERLWGESMQHLLEDYVRIPCVSSGHDKAWHEKGHIDEAARLFQGWCENQGIQGLTTEIHEIEGRSPVLLITIDANPGQGEVLPKGTDLLYGHLDKQPGMNGWKIGKGPWDPTWVDGPDGLKLYGRGPADDGYACPAAITMIKLLQDQQLPHKRTVVLIEGNEESGSDDLPHHLTALKGRIGTPDNILCLDSGAKTFGELWVTTSLRGLVDVTVTIEVLEQGVHSGAGGGIVPDPHIVLANLIGHIAYLDTQSIQEDVLTTAASDVTNQDVEQVTRMVQVIGKQGVLDGFAWVANTLPSTELQLVSRVINNTLRASLAVIDIDPAERPKGNTIAGKVVRKLSVRIPPHSDPKVVLAQLLKVLGSVQQPGCKITLEAGHAAPGWRAEPFDAALSESLNNASLTAFGKPVQYQGEGGTIPFMGMLAKVWRDASVIVTGLLGPGTNAHAPDEFLHLPTMFNIILAGAMVLADSATRALANESTTI